MGFHRYIYQLENIFLLPCMSDHFQLLHPSVEGSRGHPRVQGLLPLHHREYLPHLGHRLQGDQE